jgi:apolipoprotein N-acyltransferase
VQISDEESTSRAQPLLRGVGRSVPSGLAVWLRWVWCGSGSSAAFRLLCAAVLMGGAGVLLDAAFPGVGWWPVAPIAVAVYFAVLRRRGVGSGIILGLAFGLGFFLPRLRWSGIYVGATPWLALATAEALFMGGLGAVVALAQRRIGRVAVRLPALAGLWIGEEALRSRLPFGGFPWGRLAFSQTDAPDLGLAAIGGAPLVSFAVALSGALLAEALPTGFKLARSRADQTLLSGWLRTVTVAAAGVGVMVVGAIVPRPTGGELINIAAVQGNVPRAGLDFNAERRAVLDNHVAATQRLAAQVRAGVTAQPDVALWPENASDIDPTRNADAAAAISTAVAAIRAPTLVGAVLSEPAGKLSNVGIVWTPADGPTQRYVKRRPVPFAEYVPQRGFFRTVTTKVDLVPKDFVAGQRVGVLPMGPATIGDAICFEVAFDDLLRDTVRAGANLLVVQTNNATFGLSDESVQQLAMSRLRAVEYGRTVVHISTVGVSALIAPDGRQVIVSEPFTQLALTARLPLRTNLTSAVRLGAWPEAALSLLAGVAVGLSLLSRPRRQVGGRRRGSLNNRREEQI